MSPYRPSSRICFALASTAGGQRRILKQQGTVIDYIRKAVDAGTYRTQEEMAMIIKQRKDGVEDLRIVMNRLRQDMIRGSYIQDYPDEYLILEQHPPILDPPNTPKRILRQLQNPINPIHKLTKKYMKYYDHYTSSSSSSRSNMISSLLLRKQNHHHNNTDPMTGGPNNSEEYYRRLLGVQQAANTTTSTSSSSSSTMIGGGSKSTMGQKPALVQKAYSAAMLHYELQQQQQQQTKGGDSNNNNNNNQITMKLVDEMLSQQVSYEQAVARERRNHIIQHVYSSDSDHNDTTSTTTTTTTTTTKTKTTSLSSLSKKLIRNKRNEKAVMAVAREEEEMTKAEQTLRNETGGIKMSSSANDPFPFAKLQIDTSTGNENEQQQQQQQEAAAAEDDDDVDTSINNVDDDDDDDDSNTIDSIFHSDPRTIEGMMRWSERLDAVPYNEWTIGASTALDHWIARQVLQLSEVTWQSTLEGYDTDHLSIGRDIVACREAIFPETIIHANHIQRQHEMESDRFNEMDDDDDDREINDKTSKGMDNDNEQNLFGVDMTSSSSSSAEEEKETRSIEDLLQRLGGLRPPDAANAEPLSSSVSSVGGSQETSNMDTDSLDAITDIDMKMNQLVLELNNWRRRNVELPYDQWEYIDQETFTKWMKKYVSIVSSIAEKRHESRNILNNQNQNQMDKIDYDETRIALLADLPMNEEESNEFWDTLQDENMVEMLLDRVIDDGEPPMGTSILHASFWELPRPVQIQQLLNLGAIRPLLDEYTKETDRVRFLQRYGDIIVTGVPMDHLVSDPLGPIRASDLSRDVVVAYHINDSERFRLEQIPFRGSTLTGTTTSTTTGTTTMTMSDKEIQQQQERDAFEKSRLLYKAWNDHKAGRARYEEKLFQSGRLGLRYNDEFDTINPKTDKKGKVLSNPNNPYSRKRR